jgi:hypothetical protein
LQERERAAHIAAAEEAERARMKAARRAEADRKAGIDRRLVDMSAAEKRAIERREREKKEAEKRRWALQQQQQQDLETLRMTLPPAASRVAIQHTLPCLHDVQNGLHPTTATQQRRCSCAKPCQRDELCTSQAPELYLAL